MRVIAKNTLVNFFVAHPETKSAVERWHSIIKGGTWQNPVEVRAAFSSAVVLNGERVRFEIAGGNCRLIAAFDFRRQIAFVKFLGTHAEYDKVDALTVSQF
jgi:mRNA interferase HigB